MCTIISSISPMLQMLQMCSINAICMFYRYNIQLLILDPPFSDSIDNCVENIPDAYVTLWNINKGEDPDLSDAFLMGMKISVLRHQIGFYTLPRKSLQEVHMNSK